VDGVSATVGESVGREASAQFQFYSALAHGPVRWRLLSRNNRELGRGGIDFDSVEDCALAIKQMQQELDEFEISWRRVGHQWTWALLDGGLEVVVAGNRYDRRVRCEQSLQQFTLMAPSAPVGRSLMVSTNRRWAAGQARAMHTRPIVTPEWRHR